ncbi:FtsQ-type POTRA domain-containing protein [Alicyclobacillus sp.]|uniref:cell division protein FtsQ/DivIB n=1 Tax=Alicyclobacillus sp. TaxID=61169 RepID=UPI0025C0696D|nr:FtsQ-type POTRA domain-containing protein [Alicyclobacillus sp.]MCL6515381.1 FtsQ-type POTRA domain-containing protein [Alicyclobacillus sp.]
MQTARRNREGTAPKRRAGRLLVLGFFVFVAAVVFLESPLTRIRSVAVDGNRMTPAASILSASGLAPGMSVWKVNGRAVENAIVKALPLIESVDVRTDYLGGRVTLSVHEKHVVAVLAAGGRFYDLLQDGMVFRVSPETSGFVHPIVTADGVTSAAPGQVPANPYIPALCRALSTGVAPTGLSEIHLDRYGTASVYLANGFVAQCPADELGTRLNAVEQAIAYFQSRGYAPGLIDMTGDPPYRYTPFPAGEGSGKEHAP